MAQKDWYTNIMLDLECAHVEAPNPVLLELAAVHFDIDTGEEIGHYSTIISYQSCLDKGLVDDIVKVQDGETVKFLDGETTKFLKNDPILALTRLESKTSEITLEHALSEFSKFVERSRQMTLRMLGRRDPSRNYTQPMIWGNGAVADNVWITSAYQACNMTRPWKFYNNMCVRTFVQQAKTMTQRDFKKEVENGAKHSALSDCRTQIKYLVNARNALMPQPKETMLPSPELSFSRAEGTLLSPEVSFSNADENAKQARTLLSPEVSFSSTNENLEQALRSAASSVLTAKPKPPLVGPSPDNETISSSEVQTKASINLTTPDLLPSEPINLMAAGGSPLKRRRVVKEVVEPATSSPEGSSSRKRVAAQGRRTMQASAPRQLLTPENSFTGNSSTEPSLSAEEYEKEYEIGRQQDQRMFTSESQLL